LIVIGSRRIEFRLAARFPLASVSRQRPPAFRLRPDDGLALRDRARDARLDAAVAAPRGRCMKARSTLAISASIRLCFQPSANFACARQPVILPVVHDHGRH
jgi:hypothetical protein